MLKPAASLTAVAFAAAASGCVAINDDIPLPNSSLPHLIGVQSQPVPQVAFGFHNVDASLERRKFRRSLNEFELTLAKCRDGQITCSDSWRVYDQFVTDARKFIYDPSLNLTDIQRQELRLELTAAGVAALIVYDFEQAAETTFRRTPAVALTLSKGVCTEMAELMQITQKLLGADPRSIFLLNEGEDINGRQKLVRINGVLVPMGHLVNLAQIGNLENGFRSMVLNIQQPDEDSIRYTLQHATPKIKKMALRQIIDRLSIIEQETIQRNDAGASLLSPSEHTFRPRLAYNYDSAIVFHAPSASQYLADHGKWKANVIEGSERDSRASFGTTLAGQPEAVRERADAIIWNILKHRMNLPASAGL